MSSKSPCEQFFRAHSNDAEEKWTASVETKLRERDFASRARKYMKSGSSEPLFLFRVSRILRILIIRRRKLACAA